MRASPAARGLTCGCVSWCCARVMEVMGRSSLPSSTPCLGPECRGTFALHDLVEGARAEPSTPSRRRPLRTGVSLRYAMCGLGEKAERALRARGGRAEPPPEPPSTSPNKSITEAIMAAPLVLSSDDLVTLAQGGGDEAGNGGGSATPTHTGPPRVQSADPMPGLVRPPKFHLFRVCASLVSMDTQGSTWTHVHRRQCRACVLPLSVVSVCLCLPYRVCMPPCPSDAFNSCGVPGVGRPRSSGLGRQGRQGAHLRALAGRAELLHAEG